MVLEAIAIGSTALSIYGSFKEAEAKKKQAQAEAAAARARAAEFKKRSDANMKVAERAGQRAVLEGSFKTPVGAAGFIKENIISSYEENFATLESNLQTARINADYDYQLILSGAKAKDAEAADAYSAVPYKVASSLLSGGKDYYKASGRAPATPATPAARTP